METIIKLQPSELNQGLLQRIKEFVGDKTNVDVTISLKEIDSDYADALNRSIEQAQNDDEITAFTMDDFMEYKPAKS